MRSKLNIVHLVREAARNEKESRRSKSAHKAKFLSIKEQIQQLIYIDKIPANFVWKTLKSEGIINCSYQTFLKYCKEYIDEGNKIKQQNLNKINSKNSVRIISSSADSVPIISSSTENTNFNFNPNPKEEDLL